MNLFIGAAIVIVTLVCWRNSTGSWKPVLAVLGFMASVTLLMLLFPEGL